MLSSLFLLPAGWAADRCIGLLMPIGKMLETIEERYSGTDGLVDMARTLARITARFQVPDSQKLEIESYIRERSVQLQEKPEFSWIPGVGVFFLQLRASPFLVSEVLLKVDSSVFPLARLETLPHERLLAQLLRASSGEDKKLIDGFNPEHLMFISEGLGSDLVAAFSKRAKGSEAWVRFQLSFLIPSDFPQDLSSQLGWLKQWLESHPIAHTWYGFKPVLVQRSEVHVVLFHTPDQVLALSHALSQKGAQAFMGVQMTRKLSSPDALFQVPPWLRRVLRILGQEVALSES